MQRAASGQGKIDKSETCRVPSLEWSLKICSNLTLCNVLPAKCKARSCSNKEWGWGSLNHVEHKREQLGCHQVNSKASRVSFYELILTPRAHTDGAAASFRDEFQLLVSTQQRWAWLGAASDFPISAGAHTTQGGGPLCPILGVREKEKKEVIARI